MKYKITTEILFDGLPDRQVTEQYKSVGFAIQAYELYKKQYQGLPCSESFVTKDKILFKAQGETMSARIIFEVVAE